MDNPISLKTRAWIYLAGALVGTASGGVISTLIILQQPIAAAITGVVFGSIGGAASLIARANLADPTSGPTIVINEPEAELPFPVLPAAKTVNSPVVAQHAPSEIL